MNLDNFDRIKVAKFMSDYYSSKMYVLTRRANRNLFNVIQITVYTIFLCGILTYFKVIPTIPNLTVGILTGGFFIAGTIARLSRKKLRDIPTASMLLIYLEEIERLPAEAHEQRSLIQLIDALQGAIDKDPRELIEQAMRTPTLSKTQLIQSLYRDYRQAQKN
jgi:hypothetical protein